MKSVYLASSIQDLSALAEKSLPPIDNNTRLVLYLRSAQQILMQANMYKRDGDFEKAYIHMMKYSILILEKLPRHTQYNLPEVAKERDSAKKMVLKLLDDLEGMKLVLKKLYADEDAQKKKAAEEQAALEQEKERLRKQEQLEREEQEARIRAEQEEQRRKEEEQQREWQMDLFARQQLLSNSNNNVITDSNNNNNNDGTNILIPTPAAPAPGGGAPLSGSDISNGVGVVDPLLSPLQALQLNNSNNTLSSLSLSSQQQLPFQLPAATSSDGSTEPHLPQDFFLQQQLMLQQQQQQLLLHQQQQDALPPPPSSPMMPTSSSTSTSTLSDSATMVMPPSTTIQPSAPPAPPSSVMMMPPVVDFLTPQEPPPPPPPSSPSSGLGQQAKPLVDIPQDIYAPPPPETFHNLTSLGPSSYVSPPNAPAQKNETADYSPNGKSSVAYPNLYQRDPTPTTPPRSNNNNNATTTNYIPKYTPPPSTTNPTLPTSARFGNPTLPPSHALPAAMAVGGHHQYQQPHHFPPPSPPIQAAQHPVPYALPPGHNYMPHPTYVPPVYSRPPSVTASTVVPTQQYKPPPTHVPPPVRPTQPAISPAIPPSPSKRTPTPQGNIPSNKDSSRLPISPVDNDMIGPSKTILNTGGLRKMVVYGEMFAAFMKVASSNTNRQIETCAILSGTLMKDVFYITTMIVPKQEGTRDTCVTKNEEELFEYQMSNDLLTLGWIHTHPTQDCFMSSVDLHTHCTYQLLLPEAIAVVISPMFTPNFGIFRVSDPPGMGIIQNCNQRGFHQHADSRGKTLYTLCDHVDLVWGSNNFKVVDLR